MNKVLIFEKYLIFFYPIFFFIDIISASFFEQPFVQAVLTLYILSMLRHRPQWFVCLIPMTLLTLESFFLYGRFDVGFLYIIPITVCTITMQHFFNIHEMLYILFLAACLCLKFFVIEASLLKVHIHIPFVCMSIGINGLIMYGLLRKNRPLPYGQRRTNF